MSSQTHIPNKRGWLNPHSGIWHYLKRCSGEMYASNEMTLQEAKSEGYDLCGVCCSRFGWYDA